MRKKILEKAKDGSLVHHSSSSGNGEAAKASSAAAAVAPEPRKRGRWDQTVDEQQFVPAKKAAGPSWEDVQVR